MKFFRKNKERKTQGTLTDHISVYLNCRQRKVADWLNGKTAGVSRKSLIYGLVFFCLLFGSYLIYVLISAFNSNI
ncbi:hypothetical protein [Pedobacter helvus]|uniref:Uncharacterized protein n=1 Tax=Pedobacter helvus TaxID=2563444 RepID=A0ABW9JLY9_9SPHI|nr:hypothetical protein [Pedobacter ureilyticus]